MNGVRIAATAVLGLAALLNGVGIGTDYWVKLDYPSFQIHGGLWRKCFGSSCETFGSYERNSKRSLKILATTELCPT